MAKLDDLIQQKQQRDEDWKAKKTAEREELGQLSDDAVMHVTSEPGAYLHYQHPERQYGEHHHPCHLRDESAGLPLVCAGSTEVVLM